MMTATSGRLCTAALTKCDPIGSCVRMLVESSRWSSRATLLKWRLRKVYSTRVTHFTDTDSKRPLPLNASAKTLSVTDMPSKRLLFQLVPLMRRTDETECSSLDAETILPTPVTQDFKKRGPNSKQQGIGDLVYGMEVLLPTPIAVEREHPDRVEALKATGATKINSRNNGEQRPNGIIDFMQFYDLLPTPTATDNAHAADRVDEHGRRWTAGAQASHSMGLSDLAHHALLPTPRVESPQAKVDRLHDRTANSMPNLQSMAVYCPELLPTPTAIEGVKWTNTYNPDSQMGQSLSAMAGSGLLPTPRSNVVNEMDLNNPALAERNKSNLEEEVAKIVVSQASADGMSSRLNPLFTEEMMGFPFLWTTLPFLRQSGEPNHSKPTATQ